MMDTIARLHESLTGRYTVDRELGAGGMATVYLAEIKTTAKLQHPHILPLLEDARRRDRARPFIELTADGLADSRRELVGRPVPSKETWWGYDTIWVDDPDGNELLFPFPDQVSRAFVVNRSN
jgi:hypothetical protein